MLTILRIFLGLAMGASIMFGCFALGYNAARRKLEDLLEWRYLCVAPKDGYYYAEFKYFEGQSTYLGKKAFAVRFHAGQKINATVSGPIPEPGDIKI